MKKLSISIILVILLFTLAGCGYGEYKGNIIDKQYVKPTTTLIPIQVGKVTTMMPVHHKEQYKIKVKKEENNEIKSTWITISKEQYENISIGDYWEE